LPLKSLIWLLPLQGRRLSNIGLSGVLVNDFTGNDFLDPGPSARDPLKTDPAAQPQPGIVFPESAELDVRILLDLPEKRISGSTWQK
jgi:hypothetical protein